MPGFFSMMIDKSVLQGLKPREAKWLFHHFRINIPPVLFAEVLGDLKKTKESALSTGSSAGDVRMLSSKISSWHVDLNMEASSLIEQELRGKRFPMDGRPVVDAKPLRGKDGSLGYLVDTTPMQEVLQRWQEGDFNGMEEAFAEVWRGHLSAIDLQSLLQRTKRLRNKEVSSLDQLIPIVDGVITPPNQSFANLNNWMTIVGVDERLQRAVLDFWKRIGRPPATEFAPYTRYLARLRVTFLLGIAHHVITTRSSNLIDVEYLEYLPFTLVFASSDKLHRELFPYFSREDQYFIFGSDLKSALAEMADFYDGVSEAVRKQGTMSFADYPPVHMDNCITRIYDAAIPKWREGANQPKRKISKEENDRIMKELKPWMDAMQEQVARRS